MDHKRCFARYADVNCKRQEIIQCPCSIIEHSPLPLLFIQNATKESVTSQSVCCLPVFCTNVRMCILKKGNISREHF